MVEGKTGAPLSIDQAKAILNRSMLNRGANDFADLAEAGVDVSKRMLGKDFRISERLLGAAMTPLYGITRVVAESIAKRTGGRLEPHATQKAYEVKRQTGFRDVKGPPRPLP